MYARFLDKHPVPSDPPRETWGMEDLVSTGPDLT
jgi:hypothetical protein